MAYNNFGFDNFDFLLWLNMYSQFNLFDSLKQTASTPDYWTSAPGIKVRIEMFSNNVSSTSYNSTLISTAKNYGLDEFQVAGPQPICEYCIQYYGQIFTVGQWMPDFPAHPNCPHLWDIVYKSEVSTSLENREEAKY